MRLEVCEQIWHGFGDLCHHLLLMMDFDCPLAFRHKKGGVHMSFVLVLVLVFRRRVYFLLVRACGVV